MNEKGNEKAARAVFDVRGIDCVTCALAIEKRLKKLDGIKDVKSAIMLNEIFVDYDEQKIEVSKINEAIRKTGYSNFLIRKEA